jgi:hypothetical protein
MPSWLVLLSNPKHQAPNPNALPTANFQSNAQRASRLGVGHWACVGIWSLVLGICLTSQAPNRRVTWSDVAAFHERLWAAGLTGDSFHSYVARTHDENVRRVREGDLDHLIFFLLQSRRLSVSPAIEPALSAKALVEGMDEPTRKAFLADGLAHGARAPADVTGRIGALVRALDKPAADVRLIYFKSLVETAFPDRNQRQDGLTREYFRAMRFVYEKEFVAQRAATPASAVAELYRTRGLSTDTAVEAGYVVNLGLQIIKGLAAERRIRRVLIVGPGLDLAPRTGLRDTPPESYQPWAVIDALLATGLSRAGELEVTAADINPRVVDHLRRARAAPPRLLLATDIVEKDGLTFSREYREYFADLGTWLSTPPEPVRAEEDDEGRLRKSVRVSAALARVLRAEPLDIVTERLTAPPFDLVIATNILPYFDDRQLALAASNISAMLAPGGVFLHNEARPVLGDLTTALGLPFEQSRRTTIATITGSAPLGDCIFIHVKR